MINRCLSKEGLFLRSTAHKPICSCLLCLIAELLACISRLGFASATTPAYAFGFVLKAEMERTLAFPLHEAFT